MKSITSKWKIWSVLLVAIIFIGMVLYGVVGFNSTINSTKHYELKVTAMHIQDADKHLLEDSVEDYFSENSLKPVYSATEKYNKGETLVYKFDSDVSSHVDGVKLSAETALTGKGIAVEVNHNIATPSSILSVKNIVIFGVVFLVASFVIVLILDKIKNALLTVISTVLAGLFTFALASITRIPIGLDFISILLFGTIISGAISAGVIKVCKNTLESGEKLTSSKAADKGAIKCTSGIILGLGALVVSAISLLILGNSMLKEIGLQLIITSISIAFISLAVAPTLWAFTYDKKGKGVKTEQTPLIDSEEK